MTHPTQLELSMYADEALLADEANQMASHVDGCEICQAQLSALDAERQQLFAALHTDTMGEVVVPLVNVDLGVAAIASGVAEH